MPAPNSINYKKIGKRVCEQRQKLDLTQGELASRVGVSTSFIGHIERAEKAASMETMASLSRTLNVTLDYLVLGIKQRCEREECPLFADLRELLAVYNLNPGDLPG